MKTWKNIFIGLVAVMLVSPVIADDNCQNDDYLYVVPELALCSTHAYNGGFKSNDDLSLEDKNHMNHVVALKSTIISQQMYKQYETLDKLIKKLKTQLEKAVLTTRLEAAGAKSDGSSSGGSSSGSRVVNVKLDGASDCNDMFSVDDVLKCLQDNYRLIQTASANGTKLSNDVAGQLKDDVNVTKNLFSSIKNCTGKTVEKECTSYSQSKAFRKCFSAQANDIRTLLNCREQEKAKTARGGQG